jgi:hypothetical protein
MFFGILIRMRFDEHNPPHFHAEYGEHNASYLLDGSILVGSLPNKQDKMVREWAQDHQDELSKAWEDCRNKINPERIN